MIEATIVDDTDASSMELFKNVVDITEAALKSRLTGAGLIFVLSLA